MIRELLRKISAPRRDQACLYGRFGMTIYEVKNGQTQIFRRIQKKNQIVNDGRTAMLQLLAQMASGVLPDDNQLWSLSAGTGGIPPQITDTGLYAPVWSGVFTVLPPELSIVAMPPSTFEVQATKTIPTSDANGHTLQEAGIFMKGGTMYCRQTHPPILKQNTIQIVYDWRLGVTVEGAP